MDKKQFEVKSAEVASSLQRFHADLTDALLAELEETANQLKDAFRAEKESLTRSFNEQEKKAATKAAQRLTNLREDVQALVETSNNTFDKKLDAAVSTLKADFQAKISALHGQITDEIAEAVRSKEN